MKPRINVVLSLLIAFCFSLSSISPFYYSEQELVRDAAATLKFEVYLSNTFGLIADATLSKHAPEVPWSKVAFALMPNKEHTISGRHTSTNKLRMQPSISPFIIPVCQQNNEFRYLTRQILSNLHTEFSFFASDNSPPFYSLRQA